MNFPEELLYTKEHEWVRHDPKKEMVEIGITEYAQEKLGDIVHIELPEEEDEIHEGEPFGSVESVKAVSDIYAPTSGKVIEINTVLEDTPEVINDDPYEDGWILRVKVTDTAFLEELMNHEQYAEFVESED